MTIARNSALAALVLATQACVITPYNGEVIGKTQSVTVAGYTDGPSAGVIVEAYNWTTGAWEQIGSTTANSSPTYAAGYWSSNSPALYWYSVSVYVEDPANPATAQRWTGWPDGTARIRATNTSNGYRLYGGEYESLSCFLNTIEPTSDFYGTAYDCGYDSVEITLNYIG